MARRLDASAPDFEARFSELLSAKRDVAEDVGPAVRAIVAEVRARGDGALADFARRFDRAELSIADLKVGADEIAAAGKSCDSRVLDALKLAARRIEAYHRRQLPKDERFTDETGAALGWRWTALDSIGLYVPGGTAAYPSSVLMNAIPARIAGVARVAMATPATDGRIAPLTLAAAGIAGVTEIWRMGGAQAIAALAYGTRAIVPVDKIVGPGNAYVAAAKREVFGRVGIDAIAGPSEILVVADTDNDPAWIAADLLSQAEHDVSSQSILITDDCGFAGRVEAEIEAQLAQLPRRAIAEASWRAHGAVIVVAKIEDAAALSDRIAPEHLEIALADPRPVLDRVRHAGAIFLGAHTPEAIGDYVAGSNHVLPTARAARFSSGLSVLDFLKRTTILDCGAGALAALGPAALALAEAEGLDAHARSIRLRLKARDAKR